MFRFLIPLLAGFTLAGASAFTAAFSRWWGERTGKLLTSVLRNLLGIPLYFVGLVLAWRAPLPALFEPGVVTFALAWGLIVAGAIPVIVGHLQLGWRTHLPSVRDDLLTTGLYGRVRHPIYAGGVLVFTGVALLHPTMPFLAACALGTVFLFIQGKLEEIDLLQRLPAYREYAQSVPAYIPRLFANHPRLAQTPLTDWMWLCPPLAIALAAGAFAWWGFDWWTALLAALFLVCPALMVWGVFYAGKAPR